MAGSLLTVHTVHTRVVRRRGRADTRARTEPHAHRAETVPDTTTPYRRDFEPEAEMRNAGRDSLPYMELQVTTEVETVKQASAPAQDERPGHPDVTTQDRTIEKPRRDSDDDETTEKPRQELDALLRELKPAQLASGSGEVPAIDNTPTLEAATVPRLPPPPAREANHRADSQGRTKAGHMAWLGIVQSEPQVGASLVIGSWTRPDFCVTSPVTHVFRREDGVLVQTASKSRYFVEPSGDAYLLRKPR